MNFSVFATEQFEKKIKRLAEKYKSISSDLLPVIEAASFGLDRAKDVMLLQAKMNAMYGKVLGLK